MTTVSSDRRRPRARPSVRRLASPVSASMEASWARRDGAVEELERRAGRRARRPGGGVRAASGPLLAAGRRKDGLAHAERRRRPAGRPPSTSAAGTTSPAQHLDQVAGDHGHGGRRLDPQQGPGRVEDRRQGARRPRAPSTAARAGARASSHRISLPPRHLGRQAQSPAPAPMPACRSPTVTPTSPTLHLVMFRTAERDRITPPAVGTMPAVPGEKSGDRRRRSGQSGELCC